MNDAEAYLAYPEDRWVYNKLALAERLGYECGPAGIPVPPGKVVVRPIINLAGMGAWARVEVDIDNDDPDDALLPGEFWCRYFKGAHYSEDWRRTAVGWEPTLTVLGVADGVRRFTSWVRHQAGYPKLALAHRSLLSETSRSILADIKSAPLVNIESIGGRIIEVHLRGNPDFKSDDEVELIPIWSDSDKWEYRPDRDGARAGFMVRKR